MAFDPRDVAFALESVPGVTAVYTVPPVAGAPNAPAVFVEYTSERENDPRLVVAAHYALLRFMLNEDCAQVAFVMTLPPGIASRAKLVRLSASDRSAASTRIAARKDEVERERVEQERRAQVAAAEARAAARKAAIERAAERAAARLEWLRRPAKVLVVADDDDLASVAREAFPDGEITAVTMVKEALDRLRASLYDFVLCDARVAFGEWLLLSVAKRLGVERQVVVAVNLEERADAAGRGRRYAACLIKPVGPDVLRAIRESIVLQVDPTEPVLLDDAPAPTSAVAATPAPRPPPVARPPGPSPPPPAREPTRRARVLVVDDHPATEALGREWSADLYVVVTADPFEALEKVAHDDLDLVACSAALKTRDGQPIYRLLWNARPAIKSRFVLIFGPDAMPASVRDSRLRAALPRPVTLGKLAELVSSRPR
jgi:CheY-like chemotaxis protein